MDAVEYREAIWLNEAEVRAAIGYPALAKNAGIRGNVIIQVRINKRGTIEGLTMERGDHPLLEVACIDQLPICRFTPAMKNDQPVASWKSMIFTFR